MAKYQIGAGALFSVFLSVAAHADTATLSMDNSTTTYVTLSVDGNYGCNTADHTTCSIPVTVASHHLCAQRTDNGLWIEDNVQVPAEGHTWTLTDASGWQEKQNTQC